MKILLSYSLSHFDPNKKPEEQKYWGSSASILARTLYALLSEMGEVTYIDAQSYAGWAESKKPMFDLFVGIAANFDRITAELQPKKSILFAVNMHYRERQRILGSFLVKNRLPLTARAGWNALDLQAFDRSVTAADYVLAVGNAQTYNSFIDNGVPRHKVKMLNYGLDVASVKHASRIDQKTRRYLYVASEIGLRKGFDIIYSLFTDPAMAQKKWQLDIIGDTANPFYKEKLEQFLKAVGKKVVFHGWVESQSKQYDELVSQADYFVFPSLEEGQAGTVLDAISRGIVPLLSDNTGVDFSPLGTFEASVTSERNKDILHRSLELKEEQLNSLRQKTREYYDEFHANYEQQFETALAGCLKDELYPKFSLIISIFNKEQTITKLLQLLDRAARLYKNVEFNIILDGCKDKTEEKVRQFFANHPYEVTYDITPDIFEVKSNNIGLRKATGAYCAIIQDDNYVYDENFLFESAMFLDKSAKAAILGGLAGVNYYPRGTTTLKGSGQIVQNPNEVYWRQDEQTDPALAGRVFQVDACMRGPFIIRKSFLEEHGYLDEAYAPLYYDDMDICFRAADKGMKVYCMLMDVENQSQTMSFYDAGQWTRFGQIMARNTDIFYERWQPSDKKEYLWLNRESIHGKRIPKLLRQSPAFYLKKIFYPVVLMITSVQKLTRIFDVAYCQSLVDQLWKRRMAWVKEQAMALPAGTKVLDVGAGSTIYRQYFEHCEYISQDFCQTPDFTYGKIDIVSDICKIPLPDESVDAILCSEVFEHIPYPIEALKEISRLLKPGGTLIFSSPLGSGHHQKPYHFYGGYTRFWYEKFFPENDLEIQSITPNGGLFAHIPELIWRSRGEIVGDGKNLSLFGKFVRIMLQIFLYNLPAIIFWEFERRKVIEDFTVCFFTVAKKAEKTEKKGKK